jgi:hypothetical protein
MYSLPDNKMQPDRQIVVGYIFRILIGFCSVFSLTFGIITAPGIFSSGDVGLKAIWIIFFGIFPIFGLVWVSFLFRPNRVIGNRLAVMTIMSFVMAVTVWT